MHPDDAGEPAPPVALMSAGDLGLEVKPVYLKGLADKPDKLREACRNAGIIDASMGRPHSVGIYGAENILAYNDGYDYELGRQKRVPWAGPQPRLQARVDAWVQSVRDRLRRVTSG